MSYFLPGTDQQQTNQPDDQAEAASQQALHFLISSEVILCLDLALACS